MKNNIDIDNKRIDNSKVDNYGFWDDEEKGFELFIDLDTVYIDDECYVWDEISSNYVRWED